jgi:hypothetical protein
LNSQEGLGACTSGKILILEVQNGHFLRFQSDIWFYFCLNICMGAQFTPNFHIKLQNSILELPILSLKTAHFGK